MAFSVAVGILIGAVGWLSVKAIQSEKAEIAAGQQARLDEVASLALWRMDSFVTPLVAQESARPISAYGSLDSEQKSGNSAKGDQDIAFNAASSLPIQSQPNIVLHFLCDSKRLSCPDLANPGQQGTGRGQSSLPTQPLKEAYFAGLQKNVNFRLLADLCSAPDVITTVNPNPSSFAVQSIPNAPAKQMGTAEPIAANELTQQGANAEPVDSNLAANGAASQAGNADQQPVELSKQALSQSGSFKRSQTEFQARSKSVAENSKSLQNAGFNNYDQGVSIGSRAIEVRISMMAPHWIGNDLILVRRVDVESQEYVQGCLLDWPGLKRQLLDEVADLLPHADLKPTSDSGEAADVRRLASLPVMLIPGALPIDPAVDTAGLSPIKQSLLIAWGAMALAALAAAALLRGVIALSERRAAFVSAVTHELRTPLTTFRMYAEMLSEGMVRGEADRRQYLETLRTEADRLTHLVANVLAYARLEARQRHRSMRNDQCIETARNRDRAIGRSRCTIAIRAFHRTGCRRVVAERTGRPSRGRTNFVQLGRQCVQVRRCRDNAHVASHDCTRPKPCMHPPPRSWSRHPQRGAATIVQTISEIRSGRRSIRAPVSG